MAEFSVQPFRPEHYVAATAGHYPWDDVAAAAQLRVDRGPAWTGFVDGQIAAVGGMTILWPGLGEAWLVMTPVGMTHPTFVTRRLAKHLWAVIREHALRRVQVDVVADHLAGLDLVRALGFRDEHRMEHYGPSGEAFIRLAMFPPAPQPLADGFTHVYKAGREYIQADDGHLVPAIAGGVDGGASIIGIVTAVAAAAGTGIAAYSSYAQGQAADKSAKYNAKLAEQQAVTAQQSANAQAAAQRTQYRHILASNEAATGASGVAVDVGSPLLVMADNAAQAELNARMTEWGGQARAQGIRSEIPLLRIQGQRAAQAGMFGAGRTLLSGAVDLGDRYLKSERPPRRFLPVDSDW